MIHAAGWIEVHTGPMFSSKSLELIRAIEKGVMAKKQYQAFKPATDTRWGSNEIRSRFGAGIEAVRLKDLGSFFSLLNKDTDIVAFDEVQFFGEEIVDVCRELRRRGKTVIIAGLDLDTYEEPFGPIGSLLAIANEVHKHPAVCVECGEDAFISYRKTKEQEQVIVGSDNYEALCYDCYYDKLD